jgi:hypothetical protein
MASIKVAIKSNAGPYRLPSGYNFWRLRWDDEVPPDYKVRPAVADQNTGLPATVESLEGVFIPMPEAYQNWMWGIWRFFAPASMVAKHDALPPNKQYDSDLSRKWNTFWHSKLAWTNHGHGSDVLQSYPTETNPDKPPMARQMLTAAGNVVMQVGDRISKMGEWWIPCKALTVTDLPSLNELLASPWILHYCTTQQPQLDGTHHGIGKFPQLEENDVPLPLLSRNGIITFRERYLEPLAYGSVVPNPYHPSKTYNPATLSRNNL